VSRTRPLLLRETRGDLADAGSDHNAAALLKGVMAIAGDRRDSPASGLILRRLGSLDNAEAQRSRDRGGTV
jgi:hypothetical protein